MLSGTLAFAVASLTFAAPARADDLRPAEQDLLQGHADQSIAALRTTVAHNPGNAQAHLLLCRAWLSEQRGTEAAEECQAALDSGLAHDASAQDWAGRAFGMRAEHAGPIAGLKLAGQVRTAFHTAYELDRRNPAAANDLGEFYVNAPFIVGGGVDKALALADEIQSSLPEIAHRLRALAAEKRGDTGTAEREFIAATQVAQAAGAFVDLGCFYVRQHMTDKAVAAARRAVAVDRTFDANVVDAAGSLTDVNQTSQATQILRGYLDRGQKSDQAPAFRVHTMLGDILVREGNRDDARKEFQTALSLASSYAPARKGLGSL